MKNRYVIIATVFAVFLAAAVCISLRDSSRNTAPIGADTADTDTIPSITEAESAEPSDTTLTQKESETETTVPASYRQDKTTLSVKNGAFRYDDGEEVYITAAEYEEICGVVMNETGYGSYEGCVAVAQAIRNQIIRERALGHAYDIASVRRTYQEHYTKTPNELVRQAVTDVFYNHIVVTTEPIIAWCAGYSEWHATQVWVCSYDGNNFYKFIIKDW